MAAENLKTACRKPVEDYDTSIWAENGFTLQYYLGRKEYGISDHAQYLPEPLRRMEMVHECLLASGIEDQVSFRSAEAVNWLMDRFDGSLSTGYYFHLTNSPYGSVELLNQVSGDLCLDDRALLYDGYPKVA